MDSVKSTGTHRLLQEGAKLVSSIDDILEELGWQVGSTCAVQVSSDRSAAASAVRLVEDEERILKLLDVYPKHIDVIISQAQLGVAKVNEVLLRLELHGLIETLPGQQYRAVE